MGLLIQRRVRLGKGVWLNLSKSGVSVSSRIGRTTVNSRGRITTRIAPGISYVSTFRPSAAPRAPLTPRQRWLTAGWIGVAVLWIILLAQIL